MHRYVDKKNTTNLGFKYRPFLVRWSTVSMHSIDNERLLRRFMLILKFNGTNFKARFSVGLYASGFIEVMFKCFVFIHSDIDSPIGNTSLSDAIKGENVIARYVISTNNALVCAILHHR